MKEDDEPRENVRRTQDKSQSAKKPSVEELKPKKASPRGVAQQLTGWEKQLNTALEQLRAHEQQLQAANQQLRAKEQQLRAANQQLRAHEQQLRAANRQLEAREQQLRAMNQQLRAHEQQLHAANQQLRAREQQLQAANQQLRAHEQQLQAANQQLRASRDAIARTEAIYRRVIENAKAIPYQLRLTHGKYDFISSGAEEMLGLPADEITKAAIDELVKERIVTSPQPSQSFVARLQAFAKGDMELADKKRDAYFEEIATGKTKDNISLDLRIRTPKGETKWISDHILYIRDEKTGKVTGQLGFFQDITARKRAEEQLQQAKHAAESASRAKSQFLANISHEIRTPLNAIIGVSKTLSKHDTANLTSKQIEGLEIVQRSSQRLLMLINGVLDLSKIESGKIEVRLRPLSIDMLIAGVRSMAKTLSDKPHAKFAVQKAKSVPNTVVSDAQRLHEILTNIIGNAFKFTDQGQVLLNIYDKQNRLCFAVSDTGIGVAEKDLDRIFEEFTQLDSSTTRKYQGTGLGLTISKKTVELLGGRIQATSKPGEGTTVTFWVPLRTPDQTTPAAEQTEAKGRVAGISEQAPQAVAAPPKSSPKILIAEDDEFSRAAIKLMLENRYELAFAQDGAEAVQKYFEINPDVVLMDIMMPNVDGYDAFKDINRKASGPTVPIIALTAKAMKNDRDELLAFGFTDYIPKPIDDEALVSTIEKHLKKPQQ